MQGLDIYLRDKFACTTSHELWGWENSFSCAYTSLNSLDHFINEEESENPRMRLTMHLDNVPTSLNSLYSNIWLNYSTSPAGLAQSVERETLNLKVAGSTPAFGFIRRRSRLITFFGPFSWAHALFGFSLGYLFYLPGRRIHGVQ